MASQTSVSIRRSHSQTAHGGNNEGSSSGDNRSSSARGTLSEQSHESCIHPQPPAPLINQQSRGGSAPATTKATVTAYDTTSPNKEVHQKMDTKTAWFSLRS